MKAEETTAITDTGGNRARWRVLSLAALAFIATYRKWSQPGHDQAVVAATLVASGLSLDFMMPVGTPPGALAYSTAVVNLRQTTRNGFLVNLGTGLILVLLYYFFYL